MQVKKQKLEPYIETMDWFKIGKIIWQGCILSLYLFHFYADYIMQNVRLDESQDGIKIADRNSNNFRYAADTTNGRKWRETNEPLDENKRRMKKLD